MITQLNTVVRRHRRDYYVLAKRSRRDGDVRVIVNAGERTERWHFKKGQVRFSSGLAEKMVDLFEEPKTGQEV